MGSLAAPFGEVPVPTDNVPLQSIPSQASSTSQITTTQFIGIFVAVAPSMFLGSLDQTIVATALPVIASQLGNFSNIAWVITAYLLAATVAAPIYGRVGDSIGRKTALLGALVLFICGSIACALATGFDTLIAARALQGLGGGGLMTLSQALIGQSVSPRDRGRFQGWFGAIFALSSTLGPLLGGLLSEHVGWRWIFWINLPLGLIAAVAALRVKSDPSEGRFSFDVPGTTLFAASTVALLLALGFGPALGWASVRVILLLLAGCLGLAFVLPVERHVSTPLLSPDLLEQPVVWRAALCVLLFAAALFAGLVQVPLLLELAYGISPSTSGLLLIPLTLAQAGISTWAGIHMSTTGRPRNPLIWGLAVASLGFVSLAATLSYGPVAIAASSILFGLGLGTTMPAAQTLAQWAGGKSRLGVTTATLTFSRSVGGVIGTAVTSAILLAAIEHYAPGSAATVQATMENVTATAQQTAHMDAVLYAFRWVFAAIALCTSVAMLLAVSIPPINLADPEPETGT